MKTETYILPSFWASYLINNDDSGLSDSEYRAIQVWQECDGPASGWPIDCKEYGMTRFHDAKRQFPYACDCAEYVFPV